MDEEGERFDLAAARVCVIINAGSGKKAAAEIGQKLRDRLGPLTSELELRLTHKGSNLADMARQAVEDGFDVIGAAGGDGTQAAVAGALAGTDAVMAVIPGGTFNYFSRDLGIGQHVDEALERLTQVQKRHVHVGQVNDTVFLNNISLGAYPEILKHRENVYDRWGRSRMAAYWSAVAALWNLRQPLSLSVCANGEARHFTTALAFVAKSAYQVEAFGLEGADAIRDGHLVLMVARAHKPWPLIRAAVRLALGRSAKYADFDMIIADDMVLDSSRKRQLVAHDGEKTLMTAPFHARVLDRGLAVLVPADQEGAA